jgi:crotonobetainyl-CoA:carnitine CoA-transferase CaiB-like acyl-CoA transferase
MGTDPMDHRRALNGDRAAVPDAPLAGVRVLDFTHSLSGPFCTWLLSCLGADVVKVEPPGGEYIRASNSGTIFASTNRNKRSVTIDLRTPQGRDLAYRMVPKFDVIVEAFKPGAMDKFGLSYERVREANPGVVYASISGYGQTGPHADRPGYDVIAQAMSGIMAATGEPGRGPVRVGTAPTDYGTGCYAALAITSALIRRQRTGLGARIDACLLETAIAMMGYSYTNFSVTGERPQRWGSANESFVPYQLFAAADGDVFVGAGTDRMFRDLCAEFGLDELSTDERFADIPGRCRHRDEVISAVAATLRPLPAAEVVRRLVAIGVPTAQVNQVDETIANEQVVARGVIRTLSDPGLGDIAVTAFPVIMDGVPRVAGSPAPAPGEHTAEILDELGLADSTNGIETRP